MTLVPWEGGDSRIDWFINGGWQGHVITGAPKYTTYTGTLNVLYQNASYQSVTLVTDAGTIFNNVVLNKFSVSNTYLSLSKDGASNAYFTFVAVARYTSPEPTTSVGAEERL